MPNLVTKIIKTNHEVIDTKPANGSTFKLRELQKIVGGYVEVVQLDGDHVLVVNEEGKLRNLPLNEAATVVYWSFNGAAADANDRIVGDVLLCNVSELN
jgi:hypothetical protein